MTEQYREEGEERDPAQQDSPPESQESAPESQAPQEPGEIIAYPDSRFRRKHFIFAFVIFAVGFWFAYDGWIGWPKHNEEVRQVKADIDKAKETGDEARRIELQTKLSKMHEVYNDWSIGLQRFIAIVLPIAGFAYGWWTHQATRGYYRLSDHTLQVPGHDPISLSDIRSIDKSRWERKGIAVIRYQAHHPQRERAFKLDDFAYQRKPTDDILDRLDAYLAPPPEMNPEGYESEPQA
jgi:hypothetical protein